MLSQNIAQVCLLVYIQSHWPVQISVVGQSFHNPPPFHVIASVVRVFVYVGIPDNDLILRHTRVLQWRLQTFVSILFTKDVQNGVYVVLKNNKIEREQTLMKLPFNQQNTTEREL